MKLSSDNKDTMPITHAVYGPKPRRPDKPERKRPPDTSQKLWRRVPPELMAALRELSRLKKEKENA